MKLQLVQIIFFTEKLAVLQHLINERNGALNKLFFPFGDFILRFFTYKFG